jgi:hypothetical protein
VSDLPKTELLSIHRTVGLLKWNQLVIMLPQIRK